AVVHRKRREAFPRMVSLRVNRMGRCGQHLPVLQCPPAEPSSAGPARAETPGGRAASAECPSLWTSAPAGTPRPRSPTAEDAALCRGEPGLLLAGLIAAHTSGRCAGSPWHCTAAAACQGQAPPHLGRRQGWVCSIHVPAPTPELPPELYNTSHSQNYS
uniref:Uncharacterized protein n=1 Tax=Bubo bubo TaxID=30461 RepID=A0A8C0I7H2_BUBBB